MGERRRHLALFLPDPGNDFVAAIMEDADQAARRHGFTLQVETSNNQAVEQIQQIFAALRAPREERPDAILVMPIHDQSLERVARFALGQGIPWICLHRATGDLGALRQEFPNVAVSLVGPEQEECGRIQGRQTLEMFPQGARVLYVHGRADNESTKQRANGMRAVVDGTPVTLGERIDGNWSTADTELAVGRWLRLLIAHTQVDIVVCQNDAMAVGAMKALRDAADSLSRPALRDIPVIGCDGLPKVGRRLVDSGALAATVVLPMPASPAIDAVVAALDGGKLPPPHIRLQPQGYPVTLTARAQTTYAAPGRAS